MFCYQSQLVGWLVSSGVSQWISLLGGYLVGQLMDYALTYERLEVFAAMKKQVVFRIVTPCSDVVVYQRVGWPCCIRLHFTLKMEAAWTSERSVYYHITIWRHNLEDHDFRCMWLSSWVVSRLLRKVLRVFSVRHSYSVSRNITSRFQWTTRSEGVF